MAIPFRSSTVSRMPPAPSWAQRQLWLLYQLDPESPLDSSAVAIRLSGRLDARAFASALTELVRRHESLRTSFPAVRGEPVPAVAEPAPVPLPLLDLSGLPAESREAEARRRIAEEAGRPFDLERGPVARFRLLRLGMDEHRAVAAVHHIASDEESLRLLVREVSTLYESFADGRPSPLPELPLQYGDFAAWQRRSLSEEALAGQAAYWKRRLAGAPPVLALPTDHPRPPVQRFRGAVRSRVLPRDLAERVKAVGRAEGATPSMTFLALFCVLLHAATGELDVLVGSPLANRDGAELAGLIGRFENWVVFRIDLSGDPELREVIRRVRQAALEAREHQDLPFGRLVEELRPGRNPSHAPVFQVAYTFEDAIETSFHLPRLTLSAAGVETGRTRFDLTLNVEDGPRGLTLALEHSADLFEGATIFRLLASLEGVLQLSAERPQASLAEMKARAQEIDRRERAAEGEALENARKQSFQALRRRAVTTTPERNQSRIRR